MKFQEGGPHPVTKEKEKSPALKCPVRLCKRPGFDWKDGGPTFCPKDKMKPRARGTSKYKNVRQDSPLVGRRFDSGAERRYCEGLHLMALDGLITNLRFQETHKLEVNGLLVATYRSDASYTDGEGKEVVLDIKGHETPEFRIKKKLFRALRGFDITIVWAKDVPR